ncbi:MAG: aminotransferase class III-fold pyridoxal phosphate-dependent enzyme, partial [Rhodospirillaceae bacterium]
MPDDAATHVFHRQLAKPLPVAAGGQGVYLIDADGKKYLDASGGAAVSCLGHGDADVIEAIKAQLDQVAFAHTGFFTSQPAEDLADLLIAEAPEGFSAVYFVSGGSEAVEAALKMARQYFLEIGQPARSKFIARRQSYHGNTLGALAVGGNVWRREPFTELLTDVSHISPCYAYRDRRDDESEEKYGRRVADELDAEIRRLGPGRVAAFIAETVGGATAGVIPPVPG